MGKKKNNGKILYNENLKKQKYVTSWHKKYLFSLVVKEKNKKSTRKLCISLATEQKNKEKTTHHQC